MRQSGVPAAAVVVVLSAVAGGAFGSQAVATQDRAAAGYKLYTAALAAVERGFVEPVETEQLVYASISGMLGTLDPHSSFLDPRLFDQMQERQEGSYTGIGITIQQINGEVTVMALFEGSPAYRSGIRRGDVIAKVGEDDAIGWTTDQIVDRVRGEPGTTVDLSIRRPGVTELIPLTVERAEIAIVTVRTAFMMAPGTGYVRLQDFSDTTDDELDAALAALTDAGMTRLVLDLRDNPGGPLDQAIAVANRFLERGRMIVTTRGRIPSMNEDFPAPAAGTYTEVPLIVLVNRRSASASEIVSGAIQDHDRGLVVGETTFGKALVQSVFQVTGNERGPAAVALTTGRYYTPSGRLIQRPWDGTLDDYLTYSLRDQNGEGAHDPSALRYTAGGRKVYGGGGIEPDHFVPGLIEGFTPSRFTALLYQRGEFIAFAERFTREGDTRPGAQSAAAHVVARGWPMTLAIVEEFRTFLVDQGVRVDERALAADRAFIEAMIRFEVDNDLFGVEEARRNLSAVDPQAQSALSYFDEASQLLATRQSR